MPIFIDFLMNLQEEILKGSRLMSLNNSTCIQLIKPFKSTTLSPDKEINENRAASHRTDKDWNWLFHRKTQPKNWNRSSFTIDLNLFV